ncbi:MAG: hypothetical protein RLZZ01_1213 [Actinomycetota bacterium]|jgi:hypothetical protein
MRSRYLTSFRELAVAVLVLGGCSTADPTVVASADAPDRVLTGPQGTVGQFVVECGFDRFLADDPIVFPGRPGASHLHQFFGAVGVSVDSEYADLVDGSTTCEQRSDTASYWTPTLLVDGEPFEPIRAVAYYRAGPDVPPSSVESYPPGLMMVAGDHTAIDPQPTSVVAWTCGTGGSRSAEPPPCSADASLRGSRLRMLVTFPDCWNGVDLRSPVVPEPSMHVAYSDAGRCPDDHPVSIPQLQLAVDWPVPEPGAVLALSSGDIHSGHADFWNGWHQEKLDREVEVCIGRDLACNVSG